MFDNVLPLSFSLSLFLYGCFSFRAMSGDLEAAVVEGSTLVRVGTDIFGAR